jgi:hypothetical protein
MRTSVCLLFLFFLIKTALGQDTIIQTNGTRIIAIVQEVGTSEIKYKKYATRQTSPVYDIAKYEVASIKYADGTLDVFPATPAPYTPQTVYQLYAQPVDNGPSSISGAYVYLGGLVSPLNMYNGSDLNAYWRSLYGYETGPGKMQLNTGNAILYSFFMGGTMVFNKVSNWSYEFQFEYVPSNTIQDSASYPDGSHGTISFNYMLLNDEIQYMHATDTTNKFQIGVEASLDIGLLFGSESDVLYNSPSNPYSQPTTVNEEYDGFHVGSHFAAVGKYFIGKSKTLGLELRAGYRFMNVGASSFQFGSGYNNSLNLSGPFASVGLVLRFRAHYCINCDYDTY